MRHALRDATRYDHRRIDAAFSRYDLDTEYGYRVFLEAQAAVILPAEGQLDLADANFLPLDWADRMRGRALSRDLRDLGSSHIVLASQHRLPLSRGAVAGLCYVLEGSRLGAGFILQRLGATGPNLPVRFLSHGSEGEMWRSFVKWLGGGDWSEEDVRAAISAAKMLFQMFLQSALARPAEPAPALTCSS